MTYLYLQAENAEQFEVFKKTLANYFTHNFFTEKGRKFFVIDDVLLRINLTCKAPEFLDEVSQCYEESFYNFRFPVLCDGKYRDEYGMFQLSEEYCREQPDIVKTYAISQEKNQFKRRLADFTARAKLAKKEENLLQQTKEDAFTKQVVIVQDNHDTPDAQQLIIEQLPTFKSPTQSCYLLIEFAHSEEIDKDELSRALFFASMHPAIVTPVTLQMIEKARESGVSVMGGEHIASRGVPGNREAMRLLYVDFSFSEKIAVILRREPEAKFIVWAGSAHGSGIIRNLKIDFPELPIGMTFPGLQEPEPFFGTKSYAQNSFWLKSSGEKSNNSFRQIPAENSGDNNRLSF